MQSPLLTAALQDRLAAGLYYCNYTYEGLLFIQVYSDTIPEHCNTVFCKSVCKDAFLSSSHSSSWDATLVTENSAQNRALSCCPWCSLLCTRCSKPATESAYSTVVVEVPCSKEETLRSGPFEDLWKAMFCPEVRATAPHPIENCLTTLTAALNTDGTPL